MNLKIRLLAADKTNNRKLKAIYDTLNRSLTTEKAKSQIRIIIIPVKTYSSVF